MGRPTWPLPSSAHSKIGGAWFPATHEGVSAVAKDTEHFTSRQVIISYTRPTDEDLPAPIGLAPPITSDPPFHVDARRLILPAFAPGPINALEPAIRELCNRLLDNLGDHEIVNAGEEYAQFIPPAVIAKMLGFPPEDEDFFREIIHNIIGSADNQDDAERERLQAQTEAYFDKQIQDHIDNPRDDLTTYLLNVELGGQKLQRDHVRGTMILILVAGIDTTWSAIGASIWHLAQNPDDLARLVNEPDLMPVAIEEFLRFYAPVTMGRMVKEDFDFNGCPMKKDDWVLLGFPAANRDPAAFKDADKFIIDREENRHVAFGLGIHRCAGSNLARLELRIAIEEFIKRYPKFELANPEGVTWAAGQVRGPRNLPVKVLK